MRVYLMTDLEGVAGVANHPDWCMRTSPHYALACRYLTEEVNAAIDGFRAAGATAVTVVDGHGEGGIDRALLDPGADYLRARGPDPYPFGLDGGYDVMAWVGQHAKAGTPYTPHEFEGNAADVLTTVVTEFRDRSHECARRHATHEAVAFDQQGACAVASGSRRRDDSGRSPTADDHVVHAEDGYCPGRLGYEQGPPLSLIATPAGYACDQDAGLVCAGRRLACVHGG